MYAPFLLVHSWLRWMVLGLFLGALAQSGKRWRNGRDWDVEDEILARFVMFAFFGQVFLGFLLLVEFSPFTAAALRDWPAAMKDPALRRLLVEHPLAMGVAFLVAAGGRRATQDPTRGPVRHRDWLVAITVALGVVLVAIPWPGTAGGRPLLRLP